MAPLPRRMKLSINMSMTARVTSCANGTKCKDVAQTSSPETMSPGTWRCGVFGASANGRRVGLTMKPVGKPDAGNPHVRFDERGGETRPAPPAHEPAPLQIKCRKRHILVDTLGLLLNVVVRPADVQDRDGAFHLLRRARRLFPFIKRIFSDGGYAGRKWR